METVGTSLIPIETQNKIQEALKFFDSLREVKFTSQEEYDNGVGLCKQVKAHKDTIESDRKELVKPFNDKVSSINAECKAVTSKLENAERVLKSGMGVFFQAKERKRIEDQRKLDAEIEAKRRAEEERAEKERLKAEVYRNQGREEMAQKAEARAETAEAVATQIIAPIVENTAKTSGVSYKTTYRVVVEDLVTAIRACISNPILQTYISLDTKGIERLVAAQKGKFTCDGIKVIEDRQVSVRS